MITNNRLFIGERLSNYLENLTSQILGEIQDAPEEKVLGVGEEEWADELVSKASVAKPELHRDQLKLVDEGKVLVDVSHQTERHWSNGPQPMSGRRVTLRIPFTGDGDVFAYQASTFSMNPPIGEVKDGAVIRVYEYPHDRRPDLKAEANGLANNLEQALGWSAKDIDAYNEGLRDKILGAVKARKKEILEDHEHLDNLGIPVQKREDAPTTYSAPGIVRKPAPAQPRTTGEESKTKALEPTLVKDFYEHILKVIRAGGNAMERAPETYAALDEENLRNILLVMLNSHYEGQATGETFNAHGKTDILVRVEDKNVFIGECKFWSGPKDFSGAIDQLFGYATWRDTKMALIIFVPQDDPAVAVPKAREVLEGHEQFDEWQEAFDDSELRCTMKWPGDADKRADLNVSFVHLPAKDKEKHGKRPSRAKRVPAAVS